MKVKGCGRKKKFWELRRERKQKWEREQEQEQEQKQKSGSTESGSKGVRRNTWNVVRKEKMTQTKLKG